jgi:DNA polymerase-1
VDEPKNNAVEYFQHITTEEDAAVVWNKAKGQNIAFFFVGDVKDFAGLAIAFGEQDIYFFETGENLSAGYLAAQLGELSRDAGCSRDAGSGESSGISGNVLITSDLKKALHYFDIMGEGKDITKSCAPEDYDTYLKIRGQYFDVMVAAYLLNPLKGEYPYEDIAKDYLDLMVPSKEDLLGKMNIAEAQEKEPDKLTEWACYEAYTAWKAYRVLLENLKEKQMD